jgi:hypothetical protein
VKSKLCQKIALFVLLVIFSTTFITSCKKSELAPDPNELTDIAPPKSIDTVKYSWGDLSISRAIATDKIKYDNAGKIGSVTSIDAVGQAATILFTYQSNKIMLNTKMKDVYTLDDAGRVIFHSATNAQDSTFIFKEEQQYLYDGNGYLSKILWTINGITYHFKSTVSIITYMVQNGNYSSYTLADSTGANITRQYKFSYSDIKVNSQFSFFSPIFGDNTYVAIEKYLNFGKQSVNLLSGINFTVAMEDGSIQTGLYTATSKFDALGNISSISFYPGGYMIGMPLDNLSPLPRAVSFIYNK